MHDRRREIEDRLGRTRERVEAAVYTHLADLTLEVWHVPASPDGTIGEPVPFRAAREASYSTCAVGDRWGPAWGTSWFRITGSVPPDALDPEARVDLGWSTKSPGFQAEGLVFTADGSIVKALNPLNSWLPVTAGHQVEWYVEAASNPTIDGWRPTTLGDRRTSGPNPLYAVSLADICAVDVEVRELVWDLDVLDGLMRALGPEDARRWQLLDGLDRAMDCLDLQAIGSSAAEARAVLAPLLASPANPTAHRISAIGHAHIDSAWLWPVRETVRKVARTAANVVHLLDTTDDLVHCMSSAQQWEWLRDHQPELFARVRKHVDAGRFVAVGGMWVESDTNMVGGEAMARQFAMGKQWMIDELGVEPEEVWLPDSFGYSAALPQIVRLAGFRWFLTQKISWNTVNKFPHHTFWWEGIDGTRVFTHFPPVDTYNGNLSGGELGKAASQFRDKAVATRSLIPFGYGDGGGGPTREMLFRARRTRSLEGSPTVTIEAPRAFFEAAEEEYADRAPVWAGELYLEIHRGTYTSQARTKQGNRRCESLLREVERWSATAAVRSGYEYPAGVLRELWKTVLLQQFHDILPGSSIAWVHREAEENYARVSASLEGLLSRALEALGGLETPRSSAPRPPTSAAGGPATATRIQNDRVSVTLDEAGVIRSIRDLVHDREVLPPGGAAALLQLHPDTPIRWDAWDLDSYYRHRVTDLTGVTSLAVDGSSVVVARSFGSSNVTQRISLSERGVVVETEVDWHECEKVLKLAFDVDVHTDHARYETQFGHVVRPTHENSSWDVARFEVCAHRWVQVADASYGVALANDSTYGHDVTRHPRPGGGTFSRVRASLLRAPRFPDPETDQGRQVFRHELVVGAGVLEATVAGFELNLPALVRDGVAAAPLVDVRGPVQVEAVKLAEDGSGDVVVRLFEPQGARATAIIAPSFQAQSIREVDLLERPLDGTAWDGQRLTLRPFQIVTLRFAR
jgi:alpha-mannosidase